MAALRNLFSQRRRRVLAGQPGPVVDLQPLAVERSLLARVGGLQPLALERSLQRLALER